MNLWIIFVQAKVNNSSLVGLGYTQTLKPGESFVCTLKIDNNERSSLKT